MPLLIVVILSLARVGFLSESEDAWSNKLEDSIRKSLYEMKRFKILRAEATKELSDSSREFILDYLNLDYLIIGNLEGVEADIKVYPDIYDSLHGGYKRVAIAEMYYELKIYQRDRKEPSWVRFVGTAEEEWQQIEDAEKTAFRELKSKIDDFLRKHFALRARITDVKGRLVKIGLGRDDGVRRGMVFVASGKRGYGFFRIVEVDDTARGYLFKGASRLRRGYPVRECPHGVSFLYLDIGYVQFRTEMDDSIEHPYGIFGSLRIGRRFQLSVDGGLGFGHIFYPSIGLSLAPLSYIGEDFAFGPWVSGDLIFAFQRWRSDDGGLLLGDSTGTANGFGATAQVGAIFRYDLGRFHIVSTAGYPFATTISYWNYSKDVGGEKQSEEVPHDYLTVGRFRFKDFILKIGFGYNFEIY
ncbi:MAG TPA: hypothetical protein EYP58_00320 [bacterium (Candidatus Stahlbacteria)]|nr:hypothetical protein [Candidatus Stahlbacteria bacterium]